jgi:carbon-monoxide dehydrogenase small subunit
MTVHGGDVPVEIRVNGVAARASVDARLLLSDFLRDNLGLTGTHVGCEHGVCGACTVLLDGEPVRSCLTLAAQASGGEIRTVEGLAPEASPLHPVQAAFNAAHGMQCGFCTPGFLMTIVALRERAAPVTDEELLDHLGGHLCRCTGYDNIVQAARAALGETAR